MIFSRLEDNPGVLVIDDDPVVRRVLVVGLRHLGFPVWEAASGREALRVCTEQGDKLTYALLDIAMPGLDGICTLPLLKDKNPDLVCYYMSGNVGDYDETDLMRHGVEGILLKPFNLLDLAAMLRGQPCEQFA